MTESQQVCLEKLFSPKTHFVVSAATFISIIGVTMWFHSEWTAWKEHQQRDWTTPMQIEWESRFADANNLKRVPARTVYREFTTKSFVE